ncbi:MAG: crossover junction endodeoxyribonuclease RuvC, partial [Bryobacterales bacterium]|nr:crossover junction endodeoxyribonuclease RuvC [Bryobacterales bacterium]
MRVLGVDCGTERTGYGVIESDGKRHRLVTFGVIRTRPKDPLATRLLQIGDGLRAVIREHTPEQAAVEAVFHAANVRSALTLAHTRGVVLYAIAESGISLGEYSPMEIKTSVVGYGRAE